MNQPLISLLLAACLISSIKPANCQDQYNVWYFGFDTILTPPTAGLDFNSGNPVALLNSAMGFTEGCASYCNSVGELLFYTNGDSVWDRTHQVMPNGTINAGGFIRSSMQNSVFFPVEGDTNLYYFVGNAGKPTADNVGVMFYTTIDMNMNTGLGDIAQAVDTILTGTSERITGIKHCNGIDHWVITHLRFTNTFYSFRVTPCGIMDTVVSTIGPVENGSNWAVLKASPIGDKLSTVIGNTAGDLTTIYDFDNSTGQLTGFTVIDTAASSTVSLANMFSPDGDVFYLASGAIIPMDIFQFDLTASLISSTRTWVGAASGSFTAIALAYDFQIGRDGKLYLSNSDIQQQLSSLDAVNNPNTLGMGCNFTQAAVSLNGRYSWLGLPNHITDYLNPVPIQPNVPAFSYVANCLNDSVEVTFSDSSFVCGGVQSWSWNFGDVGSGSANVSTIQNPVHYYDSAGTYTVTLIISDGCRQDTVQQVINVQLPTVNLGADTLICDSSGIVLDAGNSGATYGWSTGASTQTIIVNSTGTYIVTVTDGLCSTVDTIVVTYGGGSNPTITGVDELCIGESTTLTTSGSGPYSWSTGDDTPSITVSPNTTTTYYVTVSDSCGTGVDSFTVVVHPTPFVNAGQDTTIILGSSAQLNGIGGPGWSWSPSTGLSCTNCQNPIATPTQTTTYTLTVVDANGCVSSDEVTVIIDNSTSIYIPNIFSPNNDGNNDILFIRGGGIKELEFVIYNRWGEKVFETTDYTAGWDGTHRGKDVNTGVFVYHVKATYHTDEEVDLKGNITLIR